MLLKRMVPGEGGESDLLFYLMFDGSFAEMLIDLGRADARAQRAEQVRFWSDAPECAAEEAQWSAAAWPRSTLNRGLPASGRAYVRHA